MPCHFRRQGLDTAAHQVVGLVGMSSISPAPPHVAHALGAIPAQMVRRGMDMTADCEQTHRYRTVAIAHRTFDHFINRGDLA